MYYSKKHEKIRFVIAVASGLAYGTSLAFREIGYCCWYPPAILGACGSIAWFSMIIYALRKRDL